MQKVILKFNKLRKLLGLIETEKLKTYLKK